MSWHVIFRPEVEDDVAQAASWYERRQPGLGAEFVEDVIRTWSQLRSNPLLNSKRHPSKNLRWRFTERFPYRVVYEVDVSTKTVVVAGVFHASRRDAVWQNRF